jgi:hypothetical protein
MYIEQWQQLQLQQHLYLVSEGKIWNQDGPLLESEEMWFQCGKRQSK